MTRAIAVFAVVVLLGGILLRAHPLRAAGVASPAARLPPRLTAGGRAIWNLEALHRKTFGSKHLCVWRGGKHPYKVFTRWDIVPRAVCAPESDFADYRYLFSPPPSSPFHISLRRKPGTFVTGVQVSNVLIQDHPVACNAKETRFLFTDRSVEPTAMGCS